MSFRTTEQMARERAQGSARQPPPGYSGAANGGAPRGPYQAGGHGVGTPQNPPPPPKPEKKRRQPVITGFIAIVLVLQLMGTFGITHWTPGLFVGGGIDRIVNYAAENGFEEASFVKLAIDATTCLFWAIMLLASSGLGTDSPPRIMPGERGGIYHQRRVAYLPPLLALLACHVVGAMIASTGLWVLALPFELGGHVGMAILLYIFLIPEGRRRLVVVEDVAGAGAGSRFHVSAGVYRKGRRWLAVRHDHLRGAELHDPLWARLFNTAHLEITYLDNGLNLTTQIIKGIGTKDELADIVALMNGRFRYGRPLLHTLPPSYANGPQRPHHQDEESAPF
jgi:hypothetical protein